MTCWEWWMTRTDDERDRDREREIESRNSVALSTTWWWWWWWWSIITYYIAKQSLYSYRCWYTSHRLWRVSSVTLSQYTEEHAVSKWKCIKILFIIILFTCWVTIILIEILGTCSVPVTLVKYLTDLPHQIFGEELSYCTKLPHE